MLLYRLLLCLYPAEYRYVFGSEMLAVFRETAIEHRVFGGLVYLRFLASEYAGLVNGALSERRFHALLAPFSGGIIFAALMHYFFYLAMFRLSTTLDRTLHRSSLPAADPLTLSITISMFGTTVLLILLPLIIFLGIRIGRRL